MACVTVCVSRVSCLRFALVEHRTGQGYGGTLPFGNTVPIYNIQVLTVPHERKSANDAHFLCEHLINNISEKREKAGEINQVPDSFVPSSS